MDSLYHLNRKSRFFRRNVWVCFLIFMMFFLPLLGISFISDFHPNPLNSQFYNDTNPDISQNGNIDDTESIIFEGNASALDITDYGNSYQLNQEVSVNNKSETNLEHYLDSQHGWEVSEIDHQLDEIYDNREWINHKEFNFINATKHVNNQDLTNDKIDNNYDNSSDKSNTLKQFHQDGAIAIRAHFVNISFERYFDFVFIEDKEENLCYQNTGYIFEPFYSPWVKGDTMNIYIESDDWISSYGYYIDQFEYLNGSIESNRWGINNNSISKTNYGYSILNDSNSNCTSMFVSLFADHYIDEDFYDARYANYSKGDFVEIYQNLTIPRGRVLDANLNFNYFADFAMEINDFYLYCEINKVKIFSVGFRDIVEAGRKKWHNTGNINIDLWTNNTNLFANSLYDRDINISFGIKSGGSVIYQGFEDQFLQVIGFNNLSLELTTVSNSSQNGINLMLNHFELIEGNEWGQSFLIDSSGWDENPIKIACNTTSPDLKFTLDTTLKGYHETKSMIDQRSNEGSLYKILNNGTIFREFYHNLYMPAEYEEFNFIINKPENWKILSVQDPTLQSRTFENGDFGDTYLKVPKSQAIYPGWWKFVAVSPNYLNLTKTKMMKDGNWVNSEFQSGDSTIIKTNISNQGEIPDLQNTNCSLKVYNPEGTLWYSEVIQPNSTTGLVQFSRIYFASQNTSGGVYEYSIFWSNGIDVGGVRSSFTINHNSSMTILKPEDIEGYKIEGYYGDIIPLRLYLTDNEKDIPISEALIYYNFTKNESYSFEEVLPGVYDAIINTETFNKAGTYNISISTSKIGFFTNGMELQLSLRERIDSNPFILPLLVASIGAASILGVLSFRSYIWLPKKRKEEEELMAKTQKFKDLQNIQAVVVIHKLSGIPLYTQGYSILEKQKRELFSGFIQAITTISEEFSGSKLIKDNRAKKQYGIERLIELDFKYFYCLIADQDDLRVVLILKNKASERLKEQVSYLCNALILKLSELFDHWDGSLNEFEEKIPEIVEDYFELYYKGDFELAHPKKIAKSRNQENLTTMETRVLNVIYSLSKNKETFKLDYVMEIVSEQKKELIMLALEGLINRKIIVPAIIEEDKDQ